MAATTKTVLSTAASLAASAMLARTVVNDFLPHEIRNYIHSAIATFLARFSSQLTVTIEEFAGLFPNQMYKAAETYISTKISPSTRRLRVAKQEESNALEVTMERGEETVDVFQGVKFRWRLVCHEKRRSVLPPRHFQHYMGMAITSEVRYLVLTFHKKHKDKALGSYLPYILDQSKTIKQEDKTIKIHTAHYEQLYGGMGEAWTGVSLDHPATFDTLAMDVEQKREVMEDLERFVRRKDYYRRVGKAWKRGYLLYGPPGTGKSSLIAAMANFLKFDVYDLELTEIQCNSALRTLLVATANQSILVVEDIDCTLDLQDRKEDNEEAVGPRGRRGPRDDKVTLSGFLNFIDGLWSSCGDERIIVFTTNHKEKLDSALLRPGRMDKHIHMSYCTPSGFKTLLSNYHMVDNHPLVGEIEGLLQEAQATPAEVAEELMKSDVLDTALNGLIKFLQGKKTEASEAASKAISIESQGSEVQETAAAGTKTS